MQLLQIVPSHSYNWQADDSESGWAEQVLVVSGVVSGGGGAGDVGMCFFFTRGVEVGGFWVDEVRETKG